MATVKELAEEMAQKIWADATRPLLRINERYNLMKARLIDGLNEAHAEGAEQMKADIRKGAEKTTITTSETVTRNDGQIEWQETVTHTFPGFAVPASVLAPKEEGK